MIKWIQDRDFWKTFDHRKQMQDECMGALRFFISFHASLKTRFIL